MAAEAVTPKKKGPPRNAVPDPKTRKALVQAERSMLHVDLTPPQEAYARGRALGMSVQEAAQAADVSTRNGRNWEKIPAMKARISELSEFATKNAILQTGLDREWVISRLMTVADRCMQTVPVLDAKGNPTGVFKFDSLGATQALKLLGDTLGMFKPTEKKPEDDFSSLSDDEVARIAAELAQQTGLLLTHDDGRTS